MNDESRNASTISDEIVRLSIAAQCGELSDADATRLNELLAESETARRAFLLAAQDAHDLRDWATEYSLRAEMEAEAEVLRDSVCSHAMPSPTSDPVQRVRLRSSRLPMSWLAAIATAATVAVAAGVVGWQLGRLAPRPLLADASSEARPSVAELTMANGCFWGGGSPQFTKLDSRVRLGDEIALHEGIAEFRLSSDVSLSIEGPAALVLTSPTSLVLQHGKVTVYVPSTVEDFRLVTPACRLTGRQTEFGVQVAGGEVDVHAFSGMVHASPALGEEHVEGYDGFGAIQNSTAAGNVFFTATIEAGRGLALSGRGDETVVSRWHEADETKFATKLSMAGPLPITDAYVKAVLASKPIGYWRFEGAHNSLVKNEIGDKGPLVVVGNVPFAGDASNRVADLGRSTTPGLFYGKNRVELSNSDYSVELWIKPSHSHTGGCVALLAELPIVQHERLGFYLQLCGTNAYWEPRARGRFRFLHRDPPGADHSVGTSCYAPKPYSLRRWQHVTAVKQGPQMRLYVDGALVAQQQDRTTLSPNLALAVGALTRPGRSGIFVGQLDELAIYARALEASEVKQHFEAVSWQPDSLEKAALDSI